MLWLWDSSGFQIGTRKSRHHVLMIGPSLMGHDLSSLTLFWFLTLAQSAEVDFRLPLLAFKIVNFRPFRAHGGPALLG